MTDEQIKRWRLILGKKADPEQKVELEAEMEQMDKTLDALYDSERKGNLGRSTPNVNRWLGDIRKYFPKSVVQLMQKDALERLNLERMLLEPELLETIEADVNLVATILSLNKVMPDKTKETARQVVRKVVEELQKRLQMKMESALRGSINRATRQFRPKFKEINWHHTIKANLKHYQPDYKSIIPERLIGYGKKRHQLKTVILLIDQSGSMSTSMVYSGVLGSIMASISAIKTHLIVFDTTVVDLTAELDDPVDLLFAAQLGGGTDINNALRYAQGLIQSPANTILVLLSDLYEGGNEAALINRVAEVKYAGTQFISLLALNDSGTPAYDRDMASYFAALGIPSFACTPDQFPSLMASAVNEEDIHQWMSKEGVVKKN